MSADAPAGSSLCRVGWMLVIGGAGVGWSGATALSAVSFDALPGMSQGSMVSSNGRVIVGISNATSAYWTKDGGTKIVHGAVGTLGGGSANAVSADGNWIVGSVRVPGGTSFGLAGYRYSSATGMEVIANQPGGTNPANYSAQAVSADGNVVLGFGEVASPSTVLTFRHNAASGVTTTIPQFPSSSPYSTANRGLSADGSVVVGGAVFQNQFVAFRATSSGMVRMPGLNPGTSSLPFQDNAMDVSDDGRFSVGWSVEGPLSNLQFRAVMWDHLTPIRLAAETARAYGVNNNGTVVVGSLGAGDSAAMIWTPTLGMRDLRNYLVNDLGLSSQLSGWTLTRAMSVSGDGRVITGWGTRSGTMTGFVAVIPEPGGLMGVLAAAGAILLRRR